MLFSNDKIARYINEHFEPTWQSVRAVPMVTVDFGGGNVIRRTLRGNIATYVCDSKGRTLDILPGIYEPKTYLAQLKQFELLSRWSKQSGQVAEGIVKKYHGDQHRTLAGGDLRLKIDAKTKMSISKARIERGVLFTLLPADEQPRDVASVRGAIPNLDSPTELAQWQPLLDDTKLNESHRRMQIHARLADKGLVAPADMTKWLYREVLDADLDDPYLGLGKLLKPSAADDH